MGQDLSSISSMDSNARRQPPPDVGVASSRLGAGETVPLIPNLVMSPGTLASDSEIQREVRVDDNVHEPTYGQSQAGEQEKKWVLLYLLKGADPPLLGQLR